VFKGLVFGVVSSAVLACFSAGGDVLSEVAACSRLRASFLSSSSVSFAFILWQEQG
jgi:hypothetical protein